MAAQIPCVDLPVSFIYANQTKATQKLSVVWCLLADEKYLAKNLIFLPDFGCSSAVADTKVCSLLNNERTTQ